MCRQTKLKKKIKKSLQQINQSTSSEASFFGKGIHVVTTLDVPPSIFTNVFA